MKGWGKMIQALRKVSVRKAGVVCIGVAIFNIMLHSLILLQIVPYTWVNGGRSESFEMACQISIMSIEVTLFTTVIKIYASRIVTLKYNKALEMFFLIFMIISLPFDIIGIAQQFLGTTFEKCCTSIVTIVVFMADIRIACEIHPITGLFFSDEKN